MKITKLDDLRIGCVVTYCCHLDIEVIEDQSKLEEIKSELFDDDGFKPEVWATKKEALGEIAGRWSDGSEERSECLRMAAECDRTAPIK